MTYEELKSQVATTVSTLNDLGFGRGDRIAVVLPNGPEMAVAFLSIAAGFVCAPLNPAYTKKEFEHYLFEVKADALIVLDDPKSQAVEVAISLGIPVIRLTAAMEKGAGTFTLAGEKGPGTSEKGFASPTDIALVLHTSGTTSDPKLILLSQSNIHNAARDTVTHYGLSEKDRCLNVMPLFYIQGLCTALLSSIIAGGSIICTPGLLAQEFVSWVDAFEPTWYTAVPAIHVEILDHSCARSPYHSLRFIRSAGQSIQPWVAEGLKNIFGAPVIEAYGMSECPVITINPMHARRAGSVGKATSTAFKILNEKGEVVPPMEKGEIAIKGASLFSGYEDNIAANSQYFRDGWFLTGDLGYVDNDDYLYISGRIKDQINRGGEKVSPAEIEEALLACPVVKEAIVFPVPDNTMGEEIGAAIVLKDGSKVTVEELRSYCSRQLAFYKVPVRWVILTAIPRGPTGKVQRKDIAGRLKIAHVADTNEKNVAAGALESALAAIFEEVLGVRRIGIDDDFFEQGGRSLAAASLFARINTEMNVKLPMNTIFESPSVRLLAHTIREKKNDTKWPVIVALKEGAKKPPLFVIHPNTGTLFEYNDIVRCLNPGRTVYGIQAIGMDGVQEPLDSIEDMARRYIEEMLKVSPKGPYHLLGYSAAGTIAFEIARQLDASGHEIGLLGMLDHMAPRYRHDRFILNRVVLKKTLHNMIRLHRGREFYMVRPTWIELLPDPQHRVAVRMFEARARYRLQKYPGRITLFISSASGYTKDNPVAIWDGMGWKKYAGKGVETVIVPGDHDSIRLMPDAKVVAQKIDVCLEKADSRSRYRHEG